MKIALLVLAVALVTILLVSDSEGGWTRRIRFRVRVRARRLQRTIRRVNHWVRRHRRAIRIGIKAYRIIRGKRSADPNCPDEMTKDQAKDVLDNLKLTCPELAVKPELGLSKAVVVAAFDAADVDDDDSLTTAELKNLETVLDAYQVCEEVATAQPPPVLI